LRKRAGRAALRSVGMKVDAQGRMPDRLTHVSRPRSALQNQILQIDLTLRKW
jgi:hypothetical protein